MTEQEVAVRMRTDPVAFARTLWPDVRFYSKQREILRAVVECDETFVPAGNMLGKDFIASFIALWFFLTRHPCRVVTTSADYSQLESVLWGEIRQRLQSSAHPLNHEQGGPLMVNHLHIRKVVHGKLCGLSYLIGRVAAKGEGMLGHHIADVGDGVPRTMAIFDEASGVEDVSYERATTWARRIVAISNPYEGNPGCSFFKKAVQGGDLIAKEG